MYVVLLLVVPVKLALINFVQNAQIPMKAGNVLASVMTC